MSVHAVLLVPVEGGLLREGACGARPPMAFDHDPYGWEAGEPRGFDNWRALDHEMNGLRVALVLAWDGLGLLEGCLRAGGPDAIHTIYRAAVDILNGIEVALAWLRQWAAARGCIIVLLDADRLEVDE